MKKSARREGIDSAGLRGGDRVSRIQQREVRWYIHVRGCGSRRKRRGDARVPSHTRGTAVMGRKALNLDTSRTAGGVLTAREYSDLFPHRGHPAVPLAYEC